MSKVAVQVRRPFQTLVVAVAIGMLAVPARSGQATEAPADPSKRADDPVAAEARRRYEEGTKAFNLGEYPRAIAEFKAAYNAKPDPLLLYNIAQSFRLGGDATQALFFYRSFLRNMPTASNRKEVEGRIRTLEKQVDEQKRETPTAVAAPPRPTAPAPAVTKPPAAEPAPAGAPPLLGTQPAPPASATTPAPAPAATVEATMPPAAEPPAVSSGAPGQAAASVDATQPTPEPPASSSPFYKKWWFWTGIGALVLIGVAANSHDKPPGSTLGAFDPMFVKPLEGGR